jgi:hypothetical protein
MPIFFSGQGQDRDEEPRVRHAPSFATWPPTLMPGMENEQTNRQIMQRGKKTKRKRLPHRQTECTLPDQWPEPD